MIGHGFRQAFSIEHLDFYMKLFDFRGVKRLNNLHLYNLHD